MNCTNHIYKEGIYTCSQCGDWLCETCTVDINGRFYCKSCISKSLSDDPSGTRPPSARPAPPRPRMPEHAPPREPYREPYREAPRTIRMKEPNWLLLLIFSFTLPGVNYMYMGLIKRGLFFMSLFFGTIYIVSVTNYELFGLVIPVIWFASMFDAFEKRRRIIAGVHVPDSVEDITCWIKKYKGVIIAVIVLALFSGGNFKPHSAFASSTLSIVIVIIGFLLLIRAVGKNSDKDDRGQ